jgi:hypothetical protein
LLQICRCYAAFLKRQSREILVEKIGKFENEAPAERNIFINQIGKELQEN